ncbi:peptide chain release factor 3 [Bradyrhizobium sp. LM3.4]
MSDIATTAESPARSPLAAEVSRRRTFAIISHPDAGKTTLTEKLLLFGGAINLAGQVKAKGERRNTRSDWMKIERERGISVVTSVMTFEFEGLVFNLLDTPGHEDFSEDTYRTLTAVDSAVMVIDAAKGIEARTRKLFEVCRLRDIPIITFINKMDRESRDVFELLDEIEKTLALDTTPMTWPVGRGREFLGTYDVVNGGVRLLEGGGAKTGAAQQIEIAELAKLNANLDVSAVKDELDLVTAASKPFELEAFREGHLTPVYFGSALRNFGVGDLLQGLGMFAPEPRAQESDQRRVEAHRSAHERLRVQDPGQHGSESPRPHRLCASVLRQAQPRHEGEARAHRQEHAAVQPAILLRAGPFGCGRGLCRRRRRHSQSWHAAHRRHVDRR